MRIKYLRFCSSGGGGGLAICGGDVPSYFPNPYPSLFKTNTYRANVRKYPPGFLVHTERYQLLTEQSGRVGIRSRVCCPAFQILTLDLISVFSCSDQYLVCYTAVFRVVTQRSSPLEWRGALRDDAKNGYKAKVREYSPEGRSRGTQREYSSKPLNIALLNVF